MSRFNTKSVKAPNTSAVTTTGVQTANHEGAVAYVRDARSELFLLAVSNFVGKDTFYEKGSDRDQRYTALVQQLAAEDFTWLRQMLKWLRHEGNLRTAPLVGAAEAIQVRLKNGLHDNNGDLIADVMGRPDEIGEYLGYRVSKYGKALSKGEKWGLEKAILRSYTERNVLKWDSASNGFRFSDAIDLIHPNPQTPEQERLFKYLLDQRHFKDGKIESLSMLTEKARWEEMAKSPTVYKNALTESDFLSRAGLTWEDVLSRLGSDIPKKDLWEALIPTMGYMALLRNLRNFDQEGVSDQVAAQVVAKLTNPDEVARSKQFPFRFLTAFRNVPSLRWSHALEVALGHSLSNVPVLKGKTLILVDVSPSMYPGYSYSTKNTTEISLADQAAVFGTALALRAEDADLVRFGGKSFPVDVPKGGSVLKILTQFKEDGGTDIPSAVKQHFKLGQHKRVVIVTDEQTRPGWLPSNMGSTYHGGSPAMRINDLVPESVPVHMWNMEGYTGSVLDNGTNRYTMGGLTDHSFKQIQLLERGLNGSWPWEQ